MARVTSVTNHGVAARSSWNPVTSISSTVCSTVEEILLQNNAMLRNACEIGLSDYLVNNAVQRSETIRNSLGLNYKSAALNQLSYAGVPIQKLFSAS